jgi:hypothetical protein
MACVLDEDFLITPDRGFRFGQFEESLAKNVTCDGSSYLRPDDNGSLLPWPYTLFWLIVHSPTVIVRVMRWDKAQILSVCLALLTLVGSIQAYKSTNLEPERILVWMPVAHILDVGAMMQICCLLIEKRGFAPLRRVLIRETGAFLGQTPGLFFLRRILSRASKFEAISLSPYFFPSPFLPRSALTTSVRHILTMLKLGRTAGSEDTETRSDTTAVPPMLEMADLGDRTADISNPELTRPLMDDVDLATTPHPQARQDTESQCISKSTQTDDSLLGEAVIALIALLLLLGLVTLQFIALIKAEIGRRRPNIEAKWCSPIFQSFAVTVLDGNCVVHQLNTSASKGITCISVPGEYQKAWLVGTVALLSVSLIFEAFDVLLLLASEPRNRCRGAKLHRPWFSMFTGILILFVLLLFGIFTASMMPPHTTESMIVFRAEPSLGGMTACRGKLTPAGIRGSILGWTDGFLHSWNATYYGQSVA